MDRAVKGRRPRYKFTLMGTDRVEWLTVALVAVVAAVGIFVMTGSLAFAVVVAVGLLFVTSTVVAML